jgi:hypothetical protein
MDQNKANDLCEQIGRLDTRSKWGMLALSIRQPFAELILRGIKTDEYRSRPTRIIGQRFHIYASKGAGKAVWSRDLAVPATLGGGSGVSPGESARKEKSV